MTEKKRPLGAAVTGKIDELRVRLNAHDRSVVTIAHFVGLREVTEFGDPGRRYEKSGDVAYVVVGPKEKMNGTRTERSDGTIIYTFTLVPE